MDDIAFEKIYVHSDRLATLICPRCGKAKTIDVSHLMKKERSVDIRVRFKCRMCTERPSEPERWRQQRGKMRRRGLCSRDFGKAEILQKESEACRSWSFCPGKTSA